MCIFTDLRILNTVSQYLCIQLNGGGKEVFCVFLAAFSNA